MRSITSVALTFGYGFRLTVAQKDSIATEYCEASNEKRHEMLTDLSGTDVRTSYDYVNTRQNVRNWAINAGVWETRHKHPTLSRAEVLRNKRRRDARLAAEAVERKGAKKTLNQIKKLKGLNRAEVLTIANLAIAAGEV